MMRPVASETAATLKKVGLFSELGDKDLERLGRQMRERIFREGSSVTQQGEHGVGFFVIAEGSATVDIDGEVRATLGPGDYFGEMALILKDGTRSATVTATTALRCYGLAPWEFKPFVAEHPEVAWALLQVLARRLQTMHI
jgi:CRP-like cAMP-binding protein